MKAAVIEEELDVALGRMIDTLADGGEGGSHEAVWQVCVTGDHSTPCVVGDHTEQPVPFLLTQIQHLPQSCTEDQIALQSTEMRKATKSDEARKMRALVEADPTVSQFDEISVASGVLGRFTGRQIRPLLESIRDKMMAGASKQAEASDACGCAATAAASPPAARLDAKL